MNSMDNTFLCTFNTGNDKKYVKTHFIDRERDVKIHQLEDTN